MKRLRVFFDVFTTVSTMILIGAAIYCSLFCHDVSFDSYILWQLLLVSFLTSAGVLLYDDDIKKKSMQIRCLIHYLAVNVITLGCGLGFGWVEKNNVIQIVGMLVVIAAVFGSVSVVSWMKAEKETKLLNERLTEYQENK